MTITISGILEKNLVRVRVPAASNDMVPVIRRKAYDSDDLLQYWRAILHFGQGLVEMQFFGLRKRDLGKKITALVQVSEWTERGKRCLRLYVHKIKGQATSRLRFLNLKAGESIPIYGSRQNVCFVPLYPQGVGVQAEAKRWVKATSNTAEIFTPQRAFMPAPRLGLWQRFVALFKRFFRLAEVSSFLTN